MVTMKIENGAIKKKARKYIDAKNKNVGGDLNQLLCTYLSRQYQLFNIPRTSANTS